MNPATSRAAVRSPQIGRIERLLGIDAYEVRGLDVRRAAGVGPRPRRTG